MLVAEEKSAARARTPAFVSHPSQQFRSNPRFYLVYDAAYAALAFGLLALKLGLGLPALFGAPRALWLVVFPVATYAAIVAQLSIHNAVHGNFPRAINRIVGEVLGVLVVVRFASWTLVHLRHHRFSDDPARDPHPNQRGFWATAKHTVVSVERQLMQEYFDRWGDTEANRAAERRRAMVSYATNALVIAAWLAYLGPWFFFVVFAPANLIAALFVIHFNWVTHGGPRGHSYRPVNLNHGYFWLGNKLFFGIYMHENHHERPFLANPAKGSAGGEGRGAKRGRS